MEERRRAERGAARHVFAVLCAAGVNDEVGANAIAASAEAASASGTKI